MAKAKRDSPRAIRRRQMKAVGDWKTLFRETQIFPLAQVRKLNTHIPKSTLYRQIKQANQQQLASPNTDIIPSFLMKNRHKQTFTPEEEQILANNVRNILIYSKYNKVDKSIIRQMAKDFYISIHPHNRGTCSTESIPFKVSGGWICRFKTRHGFNKPSKLINSESNAGIQPQPNSAVLN